MVHEVNEAGIHERNGNMLFPLLVMDKDKLLDLALAL